jgi:hypothetical protein
LGTSRLLKEVVTMAGGQSIKVGSGASDPGDNVVQLAPLMEALFDGPEPILERAAIRSEHTSPEQRYWLLQDLETLLEKAALTAPLEVCLDDLQWADNGTAADLRSLPTRLTTVPVGWVIALRPGEGSSQLRSAMDRQRAAARRHLHAQQSETGQRDPGLQPSLASDRLLPQMYV